MTVVVAVDREEVVGVDGELQGAVHVADGAEGVVNLEGRVVRK